MMATAGQDGLDNKLGWLTFEGMEGMGSIVFGATVCPDGLDDELCWVTFEGREGMGSIVFGATGGPDGSIICGERGRGIHRFQSDGQSGWLGQ